MENDLATRFIRGMVIAFAIGDVLLAVLVLGKQPSSLMALAILAGTLIAQFGLACAAILRHERLYDGSVGWLVVLVCGCGLFPVVMNQANDAGYILLFTLIIAGICLATNLLPCVVFRWVTPRGGFQFSILHIMLLMTLVGIVTMIVSLTDVFVLTAIGFVFLALAPSSIGSFLIGTISRKAIYLAAMSSMALLILVGWMLVPDFEWIGLFSLAQTLTMFVGGSVLMLVKLETPSQREPNLAATESPLPSELAPDPLDEP